MTRRSYGARPQTSRTISRQNLVRFVERPLVREILGLGWWGVTALWKGRSISGDIREMSVVTVG